MRQNTIFFLVLTLHSGEHFPNDSDACQEVLIDAHAPSNPKVAAIMKNSPVFPLTCPY
ncbi:hypothetical protein SAMN05216299_1173 [Nitrosospira sp. Nsp14]|nr:hypothetical protein SAMN05216299_1173 [Nitrosospira sp. Nsp14]